MKYIYVILAFAVLSHLLKVRISRCVYNTQQDYSYHAPSSSLGVIHTSKALSGLQLF